MFVDRLPIPRSSLPSPDPLGIALEPRHGIRDPRRDPEIAYKFICPFKRDIVLLADKRRLADIASCAYLRQRNKNVAFVIKRETIEKLLKIFPKTGSRKFWRANNSF